jgi:S-adenosylmethionine:tRNA ribosyltransferase-isomerase
VTEPFSYHLPDERIAQRPVYPYDAARLLVIHREEQWLTDSNFATLPQHLDASHLLVFNNTSVLRARLFGQEVQSEKPVEILLLEERSKGEWACLGKPAKRLEDGATLRFSESLRATVHTRLPDGRLIVSFAHNNCAASLDEIQAHAVMPIPPYIRDGKADTEDDVDYQTPFAEIPGSVAAPTASLHFTPTLRQALSAKRIQSETITLHLGAASFRPLYRENETFDPTQHRPSTERLLATPELLPRLQAHRAKGGKIVAVGTSVVRALESLARANADPQLYERGIPTDLFIEPGFKFQLVDKLITNFHQPRTTHLLLVEALLGRTLLNSSYQHALDAGYRFLSYGDGMLIG